MSPSDIECFGAHLGNPQLADLGDGRGWVNQTIELRNDYGNDVLGTCWESLVGGNHLRMWRQDGPTATTNAVFLAYVNQRVTLFSLSTNNVLIVFLRKMCVCLHLFSRSFEPGSLISFFTDATRRMSLKVTP